MWVASISRLLQRSIEGDDARQGTGDNFYKQGQILPENFLAAARERGYDEVQVRVRAQEGYDHSYYFVRLLLPIEKGSLMGVTADVYVRRGSHSL